MNMLGKPVSFIAIVRAKESRDFYENTLSLTCLSEDAYSMVFDLGETVLRIQKVDSLPGINHTVLGWEVDDIQKVVSELRERGVVFEEFSQLSQNAFGIWHAPSGAKVAWFKDPDGNTLSLTQLAT